MRNRVVFVLCLALLSFIYTGCSPKYATTTLNPKWKEIKITKVTLVPFIAVPVEEQRGLSSARINPEGVAMVTSVFLHGMEKLGYSVIPYDEGAKESITRNGTLPWDVVKSIRDKTGADAVLTGIVTRYEEREGGPAGVKKPASAGFEVNLVSTEDGVILWRGVYAETQKTLLEDVSMLPDFIKRRGKWLSVEELARGGADEILKAIHQRVLQPDVNNNQREERVY